MYAEIEDVRACGVSEQDASDNVVSEALAIATEYIGCVTGRMFEPAPLLIKRACILLAIRVYLSTDEDDTLRRKIVSETTDGHSYSLESGARSGFTGDPEIDEILRLYRRSMGIAKVGGGR